MAKRLTKFEHGILFAAAEMLRLHNVPTLVADLLKSAGLKDADVSALGDYDKETLALVNQENGMALTGLELSADYEGKLP